ncbi:MAG: DNA-3-methyladenine glycosylase I [Cyanobacteria bacterium J06632_22]
MTAPASHSPSTGTDTGLILGNDHQHRCWWPGTDKAYLTYHDREWGYPVDNDIRLFEKICLEGFQAGLSWLTILRKRDNFRRAFDGFNIERVARYTPKDIDRLVQDSGIVRHRGKIASVINNAQRACALIEETGSLAAYFWQYEPPTAERPSTCNHAVLKALSQTPTSRRLSKDLKQRGWSFVGPTTAYAFMQAMGLVNDHVEGCVIRPQVAAARQQFQRP